MKAATAVINLNALRHNLEVVRHYTATQQLWAMVKANGYGHGLLPIAHAIAAQSDGFGVARLDEALQLRAGSIVNPILLLEGFFAPAELPILAANNLQTVVHSKEQLVALEQAKLSSPLQVWLKIDTGMHRLGVRPEEASEFIARLSTCANVAQPLNFISHFACADELDNPLTLKQISLFNQLTRHQRGLKSLAASSGCLLWQDSYLDAVRPGISLYGISPLAERNGDSFGLMPVMTMTSSLLAIRVAKQGEAIGYGARWTCPCDTLLGVVAMGYGDGYPRSAPDGTPVLVNGRRVPLVGRVSMDMLIVDLGCDAQDKVGDSVILWGDGLPVEEVARHIGTIGYELVANIPSRVELVYINK